MLYYIISYHIYIVLYYLLLYYIILYYYIYYIYTPNLSRFVFKFSAVNLPCPPRSRVAGSELDVLRGAREALRQARTAPSLREFPIVG